MLSRVLAALSGAALVLSTTAAHAVLKVGDPAPKLQTGKWVQGDPVKDFEKDKVYIVEFWATWCGPCRVSIPHLNEIHAKFKDKGLVVIGQDVWEREEAGVVPFVKKMGDKMTYRVALDDKSADKEGAMATTWMKAADQNGIPTAFVINKQGRIAWIGHPMELKEKLLEDVIADKFDVKKAAAEFDQEKKNKDQIMELYGKLSKEARAEKWDDADKTLSEIEKLLPEDQRDGAGMMRFRILLGRKDYDNAYKLAGSLSDTHQDNPMLQSALAWAILSTDGIEKRYLPLAEKLAARASKAAEDKNPDVLDTLARAQFMNGKKKEAIVTEQKAVELAEEGQMKDALKKSLASYQADKLPAMEE